MRADLDLIATAAALIEFGGAVIVAWAVLRALAVLATSGIDQARLVVIAGSLSALGYKSAATLLKAIELGTWRGIGAFAAIFTLRTAIKQFLTWERARLTLPARNQASR